VSTCRYPCMIATHSSASPCTALTRWHRSRLAPLDCPRDRSHKASANVPTRTSRDAVLSDSGGSQARAGWEQCYNVEPNPGHQKRCRNILRQAVSSAKAFDGRTQGDYGRSDSVTIMGVWSEGFSCARGPLSISQPSSRLASAGDNKK
jgi:hypothetical protein